MLPDTLSEQFVLYLDVLDGGSFSAAARKHPLTPSAVALAVLPGVAGIEENPAEGSLTVLAQPGAVIFPQVSGLVAERGWRIRELDVERGRLDEVFRNLTRGTEA